MFFVFVFTRLYSNLIVDEKDVEDLADAGGGGIKVWYIVGYGLCICCGWFKELAVRVGFGLFRFVLPGQLSLLG